MMTTRQLQDEILRLKKEKDICILAHAYQSHEILEVADYTGDSYGLSQQAAKAPQKNVPNLGRKPRYQIAGYRMRNRIRRQFRVL